MNTRCFPTQAPTRSGGSKFSPPMALAALLALMLALLWPLATPAATVLGWNNLGMHCMDRDYSVFSILPPYNTIEAQLLVNGQLVTNAGYSLSYQALADPSGSINSTSVGKGNFWTYTPWLYGALAPDTGLLGWKMPGVNNQPQGMLFETANQPAAGVFTPVNWFRAEGIPLTPYDDAGRMNTYPLMRLIARDSANQPVATNDIVLPVSDEMDCRACHASGSTTGAQPLSGWVNDPNPERDYRLNILRLHDDVEFLTHNAEYDAALAARGFDTNGLYANVVADGKPVLCAACHASEALGAPSYGNIPALTTSVHGWHAHVQDPQLNLSLDSLVNRAACYRCHPGSTTRCLRGAMGSAVAADGSMAMQCQSCHGTISQVGATNRIGWFMEPACQSCHTGTATKNSGQIRYTSVFTDTNGTVRLAADPTFATTPNTPAAGLSLYRFSVGHGGLQCAACHGSTHAEFPSAQPNDNLRNVELQGHVGVMAECSACHPTVPATVNGGPHGMHPVGQSWVSQHPNVAESNRTQCQVCHGTDYRGTVLSHAQTSRSLSAFGTQNFFRGAIIGCYTCHNGPGGDSANTNAAPTVSNVTATTLTGQPVAFTLPASGTNLTLRIISQAVNGTVGLSNRLATYFPETGFVGTDTFTFAAYDGSKNSTLATGTVVVASSGSGADAPTITTQPVSQTVTAGANVSFTVVAGGTAPLNYQWQKNGTSISGATSATLTLSSVTTASAGSYTVRVSNSAGSVTSAAATLTVLTSTTNQPPSVQMVQPVSGSTYRAPAQLVLTAQAADPDGKISQVAFFAGSTGLGIGVLVSGTTNRYSMTWSNVPAGKYSLTAVATDNLGASSTSASVAITVRSSSRTNR